jgi:hypothetical protein
MQKDRRLKGYNLLLRKCLTVSFIGMLLVFACRSDSQEQDVVLRKDVLVELRTSCASGQKTKKSSLIESIIERR